MKTIPDVRAPIFIVRAFAEPLVQGYAGKNLLLRSYDLISSEDGQ